MQAAATHLLDLYVATDLGVEAATQFSVSALDN